MTENKRFVMYEHKDNDYILDSPNTSLDFIEMLGDALSSEEIVDLLNEQEETIQEYKHLVKIATSLIEWNTIPLVRREWKKHLSKVGDVE